MWQCGRSEWLSPMQIASKTARLKVFFSDWSGLLFVLGPTLITMVNLSLYAIKAVVLLDAEGNRVLSKYYGKEYVSTKDQKAFEKGLFDKTKRAQGKDPSPHVINCSLVISKFSMSWMPCVADANRFCTPSIQFAIQLCHPIANTPTASPPHSKSILRHGLGPVHVPVIIQC